MTGVVDAMRFAKKVGRQDYAMVGLCDFRGEGLISPIVSALGKFTEAEYTPGQLPDQNSWPERDYESWPDSPEAAASYPQMTGSVRNSQ